MGANCSTSYRSRRKNELSRDSSPFELLNDDLTLYILSFVSTAPFEFNDKDNYGTLTHVLPLINQHCREICALNVLWNESLYRLIMNEPNLGEGLESILETLSNDIRNYRKNPKKQKEIDEKQEIPKVSTTRKRTTRPTALTTLPPPLSPTSSRDDDEDSTTPTTATTPPFQFTTHKLLNQVISTFEQWKLTQYNSTLTTRCIYRALLIEHRHLFYPVIHLPTPTFRLNRKIVLHLSDPRYRQLIADVTADLPPLYYPNFLKIPSHRAPRFVYAYRDLEAGKRACVVEVRRCRIYRDGRADVMLVPVEVVQVETMKVRENSGGLVDAKVVRKGKRGILL